MESPILRLFIRVRGPIGFEGTSVFSQVATSKQSEFGCLTRELVINELFASGKRQCLCKGPKTTIPGPFTIKDGLSRVLSKQHLVRIGGRLILGVSLRGSGSRAFLRSFCFGGSTSRGQNLSASVVVVNFVRLCGARGISPVPCKSSTFTAGSLQLFSTFDSGLTGSIFRSNRNTTGVISVRIRRILLEGFRGQGLDNPNMGGITSRS